MEPLKIIGHRGARGLAPENTIEGFKKALECKVDGIEFDVRVARDGMAVVHHDPHIGRYRIAETDYHALKTVKPDLPTFKEALDFLVGKTNLYIEIKPKEPVQPILDIVEPYLKSNAAEFTIGSFDYSILQQVRQILPEIDLFIDERWSAVRASRRARKINAKFIVIHKRFVWFGLFRAFKNSQVKLCVYGLNTPGKAIKWHKNGLAYLMTDFPDRFTS